MIWQWKWQRAALVALSISYATTKSQFVTTLPELTLLPYPTPRPGLSRSSPSDGHTAREGKTTPNTGQPPSKPLPVGPIVGGSIGALALFAILILILVRRRRKRRSAPAPEPASGLFPVDVDGTQADDVELVGFSRAYGIRRRSNLKASLGSGSASNDARPPPTLPIRKPYYTHRTGDLESLTEETPGPGAQREGNTVPDELPAGIGFTPGSSVHRDDRTREDANGAVAVLSLPEMQERIHSLQRQVALLREDPRPASISTSGEDPPPMYSSTLGSPVK
ncbi:hypothetical protein FA15DRAFT_660710 [Coprinopsis marcescibilis]|uniref:Uncharacterized protein n=1 Tax=Coprinopsis marcescibilis TaxID=230819 RepID=A0A5C3KFC9_COPMA|nr:hypothetical protein FA15DRAFT_660710 [Coprinopsis marcescibilis]